MSKMRLEDTRVHMVTEGRDGRPAELFLMADFNTLGLDWPNFIKDPNSERIFKYECNEIMETWMAGQVGGYARYVEYKVI